MSQRQNSGRGRSGRGGRGGGRYGNRGGQNSRNNEANFKGETDEMNGNVYQLPKESENKKQFSETTEVLQRYVSKKMKHSADLNDLFKKLTNPKIEEPDDPTKLEEKSKTKMKIWEMKVKVYVEREGILRDNLLAIYAITWGQSSDGLKAKIMATKDFEIKSENYDCAWLLRTIRAITMQQDDTQDIFLSLAEARSALEIRRQQATESTPSFFKEFKGLIEAFEQHGGEIGNDKGLIDECTKNISTGHPKNNVQKFMKSIGLQIQKQSYILAELSKEKISVKSEGTSKVVDRADALDVIVPEVTRILQQMEIMMDSWDTHANECEEYDAELKRESRNKTIGVMFLLKLDRRRYGDFITELYNSHMQGTFEYPTDIGSAYALAINYRPKFVHRSRTQRSDHRRTDNRRDSDFPAIEDGSQNMMMTQHEIVPGLDGLTFQHVKCYGCNKKGHYRTQCPNTSSDARNTNLLQQNNESNNVEIDDITVPNFTLHNSSSDSSSSNSSFLQSAILHQRNSTGLPGYFILLDSQSTFSVFKTRKHVKNIKNSSKPLLYNTNGGRTSCNKTCILPDFGTIWYEPKSIANILALRDVCYQHEVIFNSNERAFRVTRKDGSFMWFRELPSGLYAYDTRTQDNSSLFKTKPKSTSYLFANTVEGNKLQYHKRELEGAEKAKLLYANLNRPSQQHFEHLLKHNLIKNCPVTVDDAKRARHIYGKDIPAIQGKMTRQKKNRKPNFHRVTIPAIIAKEYQELHICIDFFYVQNIVFFHSISKKLQFRTAANVTNRSKKTILKQLTKILRLYHGRGFRVTRVFGDKEFECIRDDIRPIGLDITPADEHVPEVERSIRTMKDWARTTIQSLPYLYLPRGMIIELISTVIQSLNQLPPLKGVNNRISPLTIMTGTDTLDYKRLTLPFGSYVQFYEDNNPKNSMNTRATAGISMSMTQNENGCYRFFNLTTKKIVTRRRYVKLPIPQSAIDIIHKIANEQEQPKLIKGCPTFLFDKEHEVQIEDQNETDEDYDNAPQDMVELEQQNEQGLYEEYEKIIANPEEKSEEADIEGENEYEYDFMIPTVEQIDGLPNVEHIRKNNTNKELGSNENDKEKTEKKITWEEVTENIDDEEEETTSNQTENEDINKEEINDDDQWEMERIQVPLPKVTRSPNTKNQRSATDKNQRSASTINTEVQRSAEQARTLDGGILSQPVGEKGEEVKNIVQHRYNTRKRGRNYNHRFDHLEDKGKTYGLSMLQLTADLSYKAENDLKGDRYNLQFLQEATSGAHMDVKAMHDYCCNFLFTQMNAEEGIKRFGDKAIAALLKEFAQLHDLNVFTAVMASSLTQEQKSNALRSINLIKEKRCGKIKGRSVADGSRQHSLYNKEDITSPTLSSDALLMTLVVDAVEDRAVGVGDIPGAYLQADMEDLVFVKMRGKSVDIMCKMDIEYEKYVTYEKGTKILYLRLNKALYGCIQSAMLWYELFRKTLEKMGFEVNPYEPCVANKMIDGKQCTICWYVDDLKVSHADKKIVKKILKKIDRKFSGSMTMNIGDDLEYLGMNIKFPRNGTVEIRMTIYIEEAIEAFPEKITKSAATPAQRDLFNIEDRGDKLDKSKAEKFHHITAKLLYVCKRCRLDIQTTISFLCTRVKEPDKKDWRKLRRLLQYLYGTKDSEYLILGADGNSIMKSWIDSAHGVHHDYKGHTGGAVSLGRGCIMAKSQKQKLNTKSSTETEVVGHSDFLPEPIWGNRFLKAQGYDFKLESHQDNKSGMKMERNGRRSCGKKSKHIDIRYFWCKDYIEKGEVSLVYCPTELMIGDFFSKPVQGGLFRRMRAVIMGRMTVDEFMTLYDPTSKERVGIDEKTSNAKLADDDVSCEMNKQEMGGRKKTSDLKRIDVKNDR